MIHPGRCDAGAAVRRYVPAAGPLLSAVRVVARIPASSGHHHDRASAHVRIHEPECVRPQSTLLVGQTPATPWAPTAASAPASLSAARSWTSPAARAARCRSRAPCLLRWVPITARALGQEQPQASGAHGRDQRADFRAWRKVRPAARPAPEQASRLAAGQLKSRQRVSMAGQRHRPGQRHPAEHPEHDRLHERGRRAHDPAQRPCKPRAGLPHAGDQPADRRHDGACDGRRQPLRVGGDLLNGSATAVASRWYAGQQLRM